MDIYSLEDLIERVDVIISFLTEREETYYVALELAHQLKEELAQYAD